MIQRIFAFKVTVGNLICWMMYVICITNGMVFIYRLLIDIQNVKALWQLGLPLEIALYSGILGIMCEYRPRNTPAQIRHDDTVLNNGLAYLTLLSVANVVLLFVSRSL